MSNETYKTIEKHGLYITIPYQIYTKRKVAAQAKLILGEIIALLKIETPFVWAANSHFGRVFSLKESTASYHINKLVDKGYITTQIFKHGCSDPRCPIQKLENHRHIYPTPTLLDISNTLSSRFKEPSQTPSKEDLHSQTNNTSETLPNGKSRQVEKANKREDFRCPLLLKEKYPSLVGKYPDGHKECVEFIAAVEDEKGHKFINLPKQFGIVHRILRAGFDFDDMDKALNEIQKSSFYQDKGWDFATVAQWLERK